MSAKNDCNKKGIHQLVGFFELLIEIDRRSRITDKTRKTIRLRAKNGALV